MAKKESFPVPYLSKLDGNIQPGQSLIVKGLATGPGSIDINLMAGSHYEVDDVPFHMSLKVKDKSISLNTFKKGAWEKEEKKKHPYKEGEPIDIRIRAHDNKFEIFINQKQLCEFDYRQPLSNVNHLYILGEVELHAVNWGGKYYPVPYEVGIEGGFTPGKKLYISAIPEIKKAKRFQVNLINAKGGDVIMHFNARFDEKIVVRNTQVGGAWQSEEREGKFPFEKEQGFDLIIANEPYAFQVYINGNHFCSYAHRADPNSVKGLEISGDVELQGVYVK